jgi:phosphatidylserine/phosphatidylglycerophosphate/cardiolipin synthase-like enzyme
VRRTVPAAARRAAHALGALVPAADAALGSAVTEGVRRHHERRLGRIGRLAALHPPAGGWAAGTPPPRAGCALEVLVDGAEALPRIAEAIEGARSHVYLAGWHFEPGFALRRGEPPLVLRNLLAAVAERAEVRVLAWAGAPLPLFRPTRREVRKTMEALGAGTRIRWALDSRERPLHCHHEKIVVVDDRVAFVGGIDLTDESGDRFDSGAHPARVRPGWHDVATRLEGAAVGDLAEHFRMRWHEVTGERLPAVVPSRQGRAGRQTVQVVRTVPEDVYGAQRRGDFRILESYLRALASAESLVYLENQFFWSPEIGHVLCDKLARPPSDRFRVVLLLPAKPSSGGDDTRGALAQLIEADAGAGRVVASTLYARAGAAADQIYVHAKLGIVDDRWLTVGSANLNEHSLFNDTEVNVVCDDPTLARATRLRLWAEHLELPESQLAGDATEVVDRQWRPTSSEQLRRQQSGLPLTHRLVQLPHVSRRSERLLGPLQGLLVDG